jgi:hypothetical protein
MKFKEATVRKLCELCGEPVERKTSPYCERCILASFQSVTVRAAWCALNNEDKKPFDAHWVRENDTIFLDMDFMTGLLLDCTETEMDNDWLRATRLQAKADRGDKAAAAELRRMQKSELHEWDSLIDGEDPCETDS